MLVSNDRWLEASGVSFVGAGKKVHYVVREAPDFGRFVRGGMRLGGLRNLNRLVMFLEVWTSRYVATVSWKLVVEKKWSRRGGGCEEGRRV